MNKLLLLALLLIPASAYSMNKKSCACKENKDLMGQPCLRIIELYKELQKDVEENLRNLKIKIDGESNRDEKLKALERVVCLANLYRFFVDEVEMRNREGAKKNASGPGSNKN